MAHEERRVAPRGRGDAVRRRREERRSARVAPCEREPEDAERRGGGEQPRHDDRGGVRRPRDGGVRFGIDAGGVVQRSHQVDGNKRQQRRRPAPCPSRSGRSRPRDRRSPRGRRRSAACRAPSSRARARTASSGSSRRPGRSTRRTRAGPRRGSSTGADRIAVGSWASQPALDLHEQQHHGQAFGQHRRPRGAADAVSRDQHDVEGHVRARAR